MFLRVFKMKLYDQPLVDLQVQNKMAALICRVDAFKALMSIKPQRK